MIQRYRASEHSNFVRTPYQGGWVKYKDHAARYADLEQQIKRQDLREWMQEKNAIIKDLEEKVEELRDGNEYILVRELRDRVAELESLIRSKHSDNL